MKKSVMAGLLLAGVCLLSAPADQAQAKEIPSDGSIPLTAEYFPDEWFLRYCEFLYDMNGDGFLSPEEREKVTAIQCLTDLPDFSMVQYFTNLRELEIGNDDGGVWVGNELDLTVFPNLEKAHLHIDSKKAPVKRLEIQIKISGLAHLKSLQIFDDISGAECNFNGSNVRIGVIDLRGNPELETVRIANVKRVIFDETNKIKSIGLINVQEVPREQIERSQKLESLDIRANVPDFTSLDLSRHRLLRTLELNGVYLETLKLPDSDNMESVSIVSNLLRDIDVSENRKLTELSLVCPKLPGVSLKYNPEITALTIHSDQLDVLDIGKNRALTFLEIKTDRLKAIDIGKNRNLLKLFIDSDSIRTLILKKNKKLENLSVSCGKLTGLDLSANTNLKWITIDATPLKTVDLAAQTKLMQLYLGNNKKLTRLDVSANRELSSLAIENTALKFLDTARLRKLRELEVKNNKKLAKLDLSKNKLLKYLSITGNKKLTKLDLTKNERLITLDVRDNGLKTLKLGEKLSLEYLNCKNNQLTKLDLSGTDTGFLPEIYCDKKVKVKGYDGKIINKVP